MIRAVGLVLVLGVTQSCKEKVVAPPLTPREVSVEGALHAVACGAVTAVWAGTPSADLPPDAPKSFATESLSFRFASGSSKGFAQTGQLFFSDWSFEIFSPDCASVALLTDHYGPFHLIKTSELEASLSGRTKPFVVSGTNPSHTAMVHGHGEWTDATHFRFESACCGTVMRFVADTAAASVTKLDERPETGRGQGL